MSLAELISGFKVAPPSLCVGGTEQVAYVAHDPERLSVRVAAGGSVRLVVLHDEPRASQVEIALEEGAALDLVELYTAEAFCEVSIRQAAASRCCATVLQLSSANGNYRIDLDGRSAANTFAAAFLADGNDHCVMRLHTSHNVPDCCSDSTVKGVAAGEAVGEFTGLVYVAADAQRTDARQQSRNILLSETARIDTKPQLEIYADDVKCTHGATVGQMDSDAILYMRQRGLSETVARRLQVEGFVGDIADRCGCEEISAALRGLIAEKMERM